MSEEVKTRKVRIVPAVAILCQECEQRREGQVIRVGYIREGVLHIPGDHHGERHTVKIDVEWLKRLMAA